MSIRDYMKEKNTERINIEFNCNNFLSYEKFIEEINSKIKNKNINNIFLKIDVSYIKEEEDFGNFI